MRINNLLYLSPVLLCASAFAAATPCPAVGNDTNGCELIITVSAVSAGGAATAFTVSTNTPDQGPYDGADDTLVGVINNSGSSLSSLSLSSTANLFGFDGDGACTFIACAGGSDPSGYAPSGVTFSGINAAGTSGTVNFGPALANNGTAWFSLEEALTANIIQPSAPEPASVLLIGLALPGLFVAYRRRNSVQ